VIQNVKNVPVELILLWVNNRGKDALLTETSEMTVEKAAVAKFEKIIAEYAPQLKVGSKMSYRIREGKVHIEVENQAKYDDVNLVVVGTHGASGFEENYIGSNAYRIVMYCKCPVITVRPNFRFHTPSNIVVLPIDSTKDTLQKIPVTCRLAKLTDDEIHILGLYSSRMKSIRHNVDKHVKQAEKYLISENIKYVIVFKEASNITKTTIEYAKSVDADLISISTEQESSTWSFLLGTYAEQMVSSSGIPVLSNTPKQLGSTQFS